VDLEDSGAVEKILQIPNVKYNENLRNKVMGNFVERKLRREWVMLE
jgi:hypothetical protein